MNKLRRKSLLFVLGFLALINGLYSSIAAPNDYREKYDEIFKIQLILSVIIIIMVLVMAIVLLRKYKSNEAISPKEIKVFHNNKLEIGWTLVATVLVLYLFFISLPPTENFAAANNKQADVTISVIGHQFYWEFAIEGVVNSSFTSLNFTTGEIIPLVLFQNTTYLLKVTSADVIHSFFVPELGFKVDAVPGHYNYVYLENIQKGEYRVTCAEYCGVNHYNMPGLIKVV